MCVCVCAVIYIYTVYMGYSALAYIYTRLRIYVLVYRKTRVVGCVRCTICTAQSAPLCRAITYTIQQYTTRISSAAAAPVLLMLCPLPSVGRTAADHIQQRFNYLVDAMRECTVETEEKKRETTTAALLLCGPFCVSLCAAFCCCLFYPCVRAPTTSQPALS